MSSEADERVIINLPGFDSAAVSNPPQTKSAILRQWLESKSERIQPPPGSMRDNGLTRQLLLCSSLYTFTIGAGLVAIHIQDSTFSEADKKLPNYEKQEEMLDLRIYGALIGVTILHFAMCWMLSYGIVRFRSITMLWTLVCLGVGEYFSAVPSTVDMRIVAALYVSSLITFLKGMISGPQADDLYKLLGNVAVIKGLNFYPDWKSCIAFVVFAVTSWGFLIKGKDDFMDKLVATRIAFWSFCGTVSIDILELLELLEQ